MKNTPDEIPLPTKSYHKQSVELVEELAKMISWIADALGLDQPPRLTTKDKRDLAKKLLPMLETTEEIDALETSSTSQLEKRKRFAILLDRFLKASLPTIPKRVNAIDRLLRTLQRSTKNPRLFELLKGTKYRRYLRHLENFVDRVFALGIETKADKFVKDAQGGDDSLPLIQSPRRLQHVIRFVVKQRNHELDIGAMDMYRTFYLELVGHYEKQIRLLLGIQLIMETGETPDYKELGNRSLGANLRSLVMSPYLAEFALGGKPTIRNAVAHNSVFMLSSKKQILFIDRERRLTLTFRGFLKETEKLLGLVYALLQYNTIFNTRKLLRIRELLASTDISSGQDNELQATTNKSYEVYGKTRIKLVGDRLGCATT